MENGFIIESNWKSLNNKDIRSAITIKYSKNDTKNCMDLEEIVSEENAVFLECETSSVCKVSLKVDLTDSIQYFTIITDCPKLELFKGKQQEYVGTYFGDILDDFEGIKVYRFDVPIDQPRVCELLVKLLPGIRQIWIYGMLVVLHHSFRPALPAMSKIDFQNVQDMLINSNLKLSSGAENFLKSYMANKAGVIPPNTEVHNSNFNACMSQPVPPLNLTNFTISDNADPKKYFPANGNLTDQNKVSVPNEGNKLEESIKSYLDEQLKELETKINQRLIQMEQRQVTAMQQVFNCMQDTISARLTQIENSQNTKLNRILDILENETIS